MCCGRRIRAAACAAVSRGGASVEARTPARATGVSVSTVFYFVLFAAIYDVFGGGRLIYATCSVLRDEGEDVVDTFLAEATPESKLLLIRRHQRDGGRRASRDRGLP